MSMTEVFGLVASLVMLVGIYPYLRGIFKGTNHPHMFSWLIWGIVTAIGFAAQLSDGAGPGAWITITNCLFCFTVAALSLRYGEKNITRSDWIAFVASLAAIPLWILTDSPLWSVLLVTLIDGVAFYPTLRKSWDAPRSEVLAPYICSSISFCLALAAMHNFSFITSFYPAMLVLINGAFVVMVLLRRSALPVA